MIFSRLRMVLTKAELQRITWEYAEPDICMTVDVHGLGCRHAEQLINNIINTLYVILAEFVLTVIHGYRRGTVLRDMLMDDFSNDHIRTRFYDVRNKGVTHLLIVN